VAGASYFHLATLVEKCWVWLDSANRYQFHELLRQFAAQQLAAFPNEERATHKRHSVYYLQWINERGPIMLRPSGREALGEVTAELQNVRQAWQWAAAQRDFAAIDRSYSHFWHCYWMTGRAQEGLALITQVLAQLEDAARDADTPLARRVLQRLTYQRGNQHYFLGDFPAAHQDYTLALALAEQLGDEGEIGRVLVSLGVVDGRRGRTTEAIDSLNRSLTHFRTAGDMDGFSDGLHELSMVYGMAGDFAQAIQMADEGLRLSRQIERLDWIAYAQDALGYFTFCQGDYDAAQAYYAAALENFRSLGHRIGAALALGGLGLVSWSTGDHIESIRLFEESLDICRQTGHRLHITSRLSILAQVAADLGDWKRARRYAEEGATLAAAIDSPDFGVHLLCCLAEARYRDGESVTACEALRAALGQARAAGFRPRLALVVLTYARLLMLRSEQLTSEAQKAHREQALCALTHLAQQPALWHIFRTQAGQLAQRVRDALPPDVAARAEAAGAAASLAELADEMAQRDFAELVATPAGA
jgi:tetratricopeptide (TPR) repeat protein